MRNKRQFFSESGFPSPVVNTTQDGEGMAYAMSFGPRVQGTPGGAYLERQSIRQQVVKFRVQASEYLSRYRLGLQAELNYPIARGNSIINTAPSNIGSGPSGRSGTMRPPPRYRKALPLPVVPYSPPTY